MQPYSEQYRTGDIIFAEGDAPATAYLIERGRVEISTMQFGERRVLGCLGPGMLLGETAVIDESPRNATALALTDCELTPIDARQFAERLAVADPVVRALLMSQLSRYRTTLETLSGDVPSTVTAAHANDDAFDKIRLEGELRAALERQELEVLLQPIEEIDTGIVAGYEALVRWTHPERGEVAPLEFIRLAEETSLILPVGDYILERVCEMLSELARRGQQPLPFIALNLSARQLDDPRLVERIFAHLRERNLPPDRLKLEITENLVFDHAKIASLLNQCHAVGMHVALDDFGAGYSNLAPLLDLAFDQIKLDGQFVKGLATPRGVAIARVVVAMARALECGLIAEGVETIEQRHILRQLGCRYAQGWLVGRPAKLADVLNR